MTRRGDDVIYCDRVFYKVYVDRVDRVDTIVLDRLIGMDDCRDDCHVSYVYWSLPKTNHDHELFTYDEEG